MPPEPTSRDRTSLDPQESGLHNRRLSLATAALLPVAATAILYAFGVPLGLPGRFIYRYSPVVAWRLRALPWAVLLAAVAALGVWLLLADRAARRRAGLALVGAAFVGLAAWAYLAPPDHVVQHVFNMLSPSQDGAFLREADQISSVRTYLRDFPQRARTPPAQMRGTRVISNPPGTTLLAWAVQHSLAASEFLRSYFRPEMNVDDPKLAAFPDEAAAGLAFCWTLAVLWLLAAVPLYGVLRLFFPPPPAAALTVCMLISPATLLFTPGKDPAQLLAVALPLWLWLLGQRRRWLWAATASGVTFICACMVSLAHVWIAVVVLAANLWSALRQPAGMRLFILRGILPTTIGAVLAALVLYYGLGLDVVATARAVAHAQAEVTRGPGAMPLVWQLLGFPLWILFAGPALWFAAILCLTPLRAVERIGDEDARFGAALAICCALALAATVGFTNVETPRLWLPFGVLLLLGSVLLLRRFRQPNRVSGGLLVGVVFVQIVASALQWALMDVRETEYRLVTSRYFS